MYLLKDKKFHSCLKSIQITPLSVYDNGKNITIQSNVILAFHENKAKKIVGNLEIYYDIVKKLT